MTDQNIIEIRKGETYRKYNFIKLYLIESKTSLKKNVVRFRIHVCALDRLETVVQPERGSYI